MKIKKLLPHLIMPAMSLTFFGALIYSSPRWKELGNNILVREVGNSRQFYIGTQRGQDIVAIDKGKDATLDYVIQGFDMSLFGENGYRLGVNEITKEEMKRYKQANDLLKNLEKNKNDK